MNRKKAMRLAFRVLALLVIIAVAVLFVRALAAGWDRVQEYEIALDPVWLVALLLFSAAIVASGVLWGRVVRDVTPDSRIPMLEAVRAHLGSWVVRYVPGIGTVAYKLAWARRRGIQTLDAFVAFTYESIFLQIASLLGGSVVLLVVIGPDLVAQNGLVIALVLVLLVGFGLALSRRVIKPVLGFLATRRLKERVDQLPLLPTWRSVVFVVEYLVPRVVNGVAVVVVATTLIGPMTPDLWFVLAAAYAVATAAGILAVFAPGGLGVREAVFVGVLIAASFESVDAIVLSIAARFVATISDLVVAGIYLALTAATRKGRPTDEAAEEGGNGVTTGPDSPHVSIIGSAFSGNKGAAAMLESAIESILAEFPDATFTLFSMYPREDREQNRFSQVELVDARPRPLGVTINSLALLYKILPPLRPLLRTRSRAISALSRSDVLLDQMGISFTDGREKFLLYNVAAILPAFFLKVPVVKCAQAIGPFKNPINRAVSRIFLPKVHTIVTRGRFTHEFAIELGLENLVAGSDSAFALKLSGAERESVTAALDMSFFDGGDTVVGISPSVVVQAKYEAKTGGDYLALMADFANGLLASGYRVMLVPHSVRTGTDKTQNNDLPLCVALYELLESTDRVLFADRELSSQDLRYLISRCDFFVTSRFHAMVSSLSVGVPCLVIGWSHKYQEVLEMFGLEEWAIGFDRLAPELLRKRADDLIAQGPAVAAAITAHLPAVIENTRHQERVILDLLRTSRKAAS